MKRAILLGAAPIAPPDLKRLISLLKITDRDLLIGVDGGTAIWFKQGFKPDLAVGDWDSLSVSGRAGPSRALVTASKKRILHRIPSMSLPVTKDRSDLFHALSLAVFAGSSQMVCLGVTGSRPDHHFASLLEMSGFGASLSSVESVTALGPEAQYEFLSENRPIWRGSEALQGLRKGRLISVFAMGKSADGVTLKGLKYPLRSAKLEASSRGLSNEVVQPRSTEIRLKKGQLLVVLPS